MPQIRKRSLLWDWTNTRSNPQHISQISFSPSSPFISCSNWNTWAPPELPPSVPFRPTIRTPAQLEGDEFLWVENSQWEIVHFLNEPERQGISPTEAAQLWRAKVLRLKERGKLVVGCSCASDEQGMKWLEEWMTLVEEGGDGPNYLGVHYYGTVAEECITYLEQLHAKYPAYEMFVSEIASISRDKEEVWDFTVRMAKWMDECSWIKEYSFFGCMTEVADAFVSPEAQLMDGNGKMTELMKKLLE